MGILSLGDWSGCPLVAYGNACDGVAHFFSSAASTAADTPGVSTSSSSWSLPNDSCRAVFGLVAEVATAVSTAAADERSRLVLPVRWTGVAGTGASCASGVTPDDNDMLLSLSLASTADSTPAAVPTSSRTTNLPVVPPVGELDILRYLFGLV
jgi:hypothetical protein